MELDPILLARIQFALNISFHILFPSITIALGWILFYFRIRYTTSNQREWEYAYYFWVKIFALTFALGVVSGVTMSFQFGTNWPGFLEQVGNIAGPLIGYEVLTAFFLEASFLGIMLFGKDRVSNKVHLIASFLVALGTTLSAFWILVLNSWMQSPQGFYIENEQFFVKDWFEIIFNPTFPYMFLHVVNASFLTCAFLLAGVSAWRIKKNVDGPATHRVFRTGVFLAVVLAPLQLFIGDQYGLHTLKTQPAKIAAIESIWESGDGVEFTLFGIPDEEEKKTHLAITIPKLASLLLTHDADGYLQGINDFEDAHPPVAPVFYSFRIMVGIGLLMILISTWGTWTLIRKKDLSNKLLTAYSWMTFSGWVAVLAGWYVTEIGRQPFIVYGHIRVAEVAADHTGTEIGITLLTYILVYAFLLISYIAALRTMSDNPAKSQTLIHDYSSTESLGK
ncbi:MAG: cytochrome ubiquinol oxidase subunit I [Pseudomonadota bacterium]